MTFDLISPARLREKMAPDATAEYALIDVRELGVHSEGHPFFAVPLPLSQLELKALKLLPRKSVPLYILDQGPELPLAERAAELLAGFGYSDIRLVERGVEGWREAGFEIFSGINVPSKAFGEFVEEAYGTPHITASDLAERQKQGEKIVILDSRPFREFHRMSIPGGIDMPGAELVHRVYETVPDADTQIVVNCAGRTRSIIGAQSLINAGIPNPVAALKDGTMGWHLADLKLAHKENRVAPPPGPDAGSRSQQSADQVATRFGVKTIDLDTLEAWQQERETRSLYLLDVRDEAEYLAGHFPGALHAPGGQLVQATDEYVATRNARIVLIDGESVRAVMTASWLLQMNWPEVFVLQTSPDRFTETGPSAGAEIEQTPVISAHELDAALASGEPIAVIDLGSSPAYRAGHIPGAYWAIRARLDKDLIFVPPMGLIVLTSKDGDIAHLAAQEVARLRPGTLIRVLDGGTAAWKQASLPLEKGETQLLSRLDDLWSRPYDTSDPEEVRKRMQDYLTWEVGLMQQIERDGLVRFQRFEP